jgi:hypothetical protein
MPVQVDKVEVIKCYRPGDIVRARVISLGDARQYYLSTAENELGVSDDDDDVDDDGDGGGRRRSRTMIMIMSC